MSSGSLPNHSHRNDRQRPAVSARTAKAPGEENPSPDLIAAGPDETVIVEVKAGRGPQHNSGVEELARALEDRPGWRFEFVALPVPLTASRWDALRRETLRTASILVVASCSKAPGIWRWSDFGFLWSSCFART